MKIILGISLALNLVLASVLIFTRPRPVNQERLIIETHSNNSVKEFVKEPLSPSVPQTKSTVTEGKKSANPMFLGPHDQQDVQEAGEKMEQERQEFMVQELGMSEDKISEHNRIREEYFRKTSKFWENKNPMREPTFEERKKMIQLEEEFHRNLEKLHGKKNWEKYQKFREGHNQKGFQKQIDENQPFLFMGI